ncbi:MAG TPA: carbon monoxide dehydrogenase subunit G [Allosphingosinicella sp.]|nr:carbon monoxide dehydrogenase subunit G [Allosphingosinicella sp.]
MKLTGEYRIAADREAVWTAINDPAVLQQCIPGCEEIVKIDPTHWTAKVTTKVGPIKARFSGNIRLEDLNEPASCRIVGEGTGGAAGFAKGGALVTLTEDGADTVLRYEADVQIGGKLAQIGSRLIDSFAGKFADQFFASFAAIVSGADRGQAAPAPVAGAAVSERTPAGAVAATVAPPETIAPVAPALERAHLPAAPAREGGRFDSQSFTIVVLAALLVFMTIMYALKG